MRIFELAYCCRLYAEGTWYDVALARFLEGTSPVVACGKLLGDERAPTVAHEEP
jgi:hypothetical protein